MYLRFYQTGDVRQSPDSCCRTPDCIRHHSWHTDPQRHRDRQSKHASSALYSEGNNSFWHSQLLHLLVLHHACSLWTKIKFFIDILKWRFISDYLVLFIRTDDLDVCCHCCCSKLWYACRSVLVLADVPLCHRLTSPHCQKPRHCALASTIIRLIHGLTVTHGAN